MQNILSIWGQGDVGKSTLLTRLIEEGRALAFKDYWLTVIVDERQTTPISIMELYRQERQRCEAPHINSAYMTIIQISTN